MDYDRCLTLRPGTGLLRIYVYGDGFIGVGCEDRRTLAEWRREGRSIAKGHRWGEADIKLYTMAVKDAVALAKKYGIIRKPRKANRGKRT